jgi:hypothetical protein
MFPVRTILILAVVAMVIVAIFMAVASDRPDEILFAEFFWNLIARAIGLLLAGSAALTILLMAFGTISLERCAVLATAMLGGLMLISPQWGTSLALGLVVGAMLLSGRVGTIGARPDRDV